MTTEPVPTTVTATRYPDDEAAARNAALYLGEVSIAGVPVLTARHLAHVTLPADAAEQAAREYAAAVFARELRDLLAGRPATETENTNRRAVPSEQRRKEADQLRRDADRYAREGDQPNAAAARSAAKRLEADRPEPPEWRQHRPGPGQMPEYPTPGTGGPRLDEVDARLSWVLRVLGDEFGPLGVIRAAHQMWPDAAVVAALPEVDT